MSGRCAGDYSFGSSDLYRLVRDSGLPVACGRGSHGSFPFTERHLKCAWFDSSLRPGNLLTHDGKVVTVEHPGRWNLEAGPDFLGACFLVKTGGRRQSRAGGGEGLRADAGRTAQRVAGDVEIHVNAADWQRHGHDRDPAYRNVRAHVTYNPGCLRSGLLPKGALQLSLKEALAADPMFSFESLDVTAYPFSHPIPPAPCSVVLKNKHPDLLESLLNAAGQERLRRKSERMAVAIDEKGSGQVLYEETMIALGYKKNRGQFRLLAERLPAIELREESGLDETAGYALLMGVAGLLPARIRADWDSETRSFVRQLWNSWWKHQFRWQDRAMEKRDWITSGVRPQNHPQRRLMAAASLFCRPVALERQLMETSLGGSDRRLDRISSLIRGAGSRADYWSFRLGFGCERLSRRVSLTGERRTASVLLNVVIPFIAAASPHAFNLASLQEMPSEEDNSIVRQTAFALFGSDHNPSLYRTGLRQQGLMQIFHDYCLNDRSGCNSCPFPAMLERFCGRS